LHGPITLHLLTANLTIPYTCLTLGS